jgi:ribonuclease HII
MAHLKARFFEDDLPELGLDEAGRGSFWGPIVAGAVMLPREWTEEQRALFGQLRDSKKLTPKKRAVLAAGIRGLVTACGTGMVSAEEINAHGISWANREAFRRAATGVMDAAGLTVDKVRILVDGVLAVDGWEGEQQLIVEGDDKYVAIAAASILAKVTHDEWVQEYCEAHPECAERYDLRSCNGYGTAKHRAGIQRYGGHELHRVVYIERWLPGREPGPPRRRAREERERGGFMIRL